MSGYPNQQNHHPMQQQQPQIMYQQQHQDPMMIPPQQGNQAMQINYGMSGMSQPSDAYMQGQHYQMAAPSGMNPLVYNSISSNFQARSPYSISGMSGPHSIPQPTCVNPLSVPPQGPGSVPGQGPLSVPQQGPSSVQGPMSVPQQGPGSVPGQGPLSVPQPGSLMGGGPGSVGQPVEGSTMGGLTVCGGINSNQGPSPSSLSIPSHLGPSPLIEGGRSPMTCVLIGGPSPSNLHQGTSPSFNPLSHGPQSASAFNPSTPHTAPPPPPPSATPYNVQSQQKKDEESHPYDGIFLMDPMQLSKQLISKDLRVSFSEMNRSMGELLKNRDNLTLEQNEKYTRDYNEFMAVCDQVEQALTIVMETSKMMSKLDRSYTEGGNTGRTNDYSIQPLSNYVDETTAMTSNVEKTVSGVFEIMSKIRKREALHDVNNKKGTEDIKMETD